VPRCGALSLLQKPVHYRGRSEELVLSPFVVAFGLFFARACGSRGCPRRTCRPRSRRKARWRGRGAHRYRRSTRRCLGDTAKIFSRGLKSGNRSESVYGYKSLVQMAGPYRTTLRRRHFSWPIFTVHLVLYIGHAELGA